MTKAEQTRKIMEEAMAAKSNKYQNKSRAYARRVIECKLNKRAKKGYNNCEFKMSRWYSPTIVIETLERMGYEVKRNSKNGRAVLVVKW